jgi:hypothetical protein
MRPDVIGKCAVMVVVDCRTIELYLYFFFSKSRECPWPLHQLMHTAIKNLLCGIQKQCHEIELLVGHMGNESEKDRIASQWT